jgi:hypothetical protein
LLQEPITIHNAPMGEGHSSRRSIRNRSADAASRGST